MYSLGYDRYYNELDYKITPETNLNWGLKDIEYFDQSVDILKTVDQPFYARFLTLTNHYPFTYDEDTKFIEPYNSGNGVFDRYIVTARYLDESIKNLLSV